jgi:dihydrofolate reductase
MSLSLIVAMTRRGVIGRAGQLPWRLPADLAHFRARTWGHSVILGRRTFTSLKRPLVGRRLIVLSRDPQFLPPAGVNRVATWDEALDLAFRGDPEPLVMGGAEVYRLALPVAERLLVTWVEADFPGDVFFPPWDRSLWRLWEARRLGADRKNACDYTFCEYRRVRPAEEDRADGPFGGSGIAEPQPEAAGRDRGGRLEHVCLPVR